MSKTVKKAAKKPASKKKTAPKKSSIVKKKTGAAKKVAKPVKKAAAKKAATKKVVTKKVAPKKPAAKKVAPKKAAPKKVEAKKSAPAKKALAKVTASAKAEVKKTVPANLPATARPKQKQAGKITSPLLLAIIEGLEEKKAKNITVLDLNRIEGRSFDYFVIADADSGTHVESIAGSVEEEVKKKISERPFHTEGWQNAEWILLDYINVVVHVFQRPVREFYNLEGLWADAEVQKIN